LRTPTTRRRTDVVNEFVRVERGLLDLEDLVAIHELARSCGVKRWGTVRRRSVGGSGWKAPTNTLVRLTSRFSGLAIEKLAVSGLCAKQADYLIYSPGDSAGWHDHIGESKCFLVALLNDSFVGGQFQIRSTATAKKKGSPHLMNDDTTTTVDLGMGDVVFCESFVEHRVLGVTEGTRVSLNVDFWAEETGRLDRRSIHDRR